MVDLYHRLSADGLGINHFRLGIGSFLGCMAPWGGAGMYPEMTDGVVALPCQPAEIRGRNWIMRRAAAEAIRHDPDYKDGNYEKQPSHYIYDTAGQSFMTESPARIQEMAPTRAPAQAPHEKRLEAERRDANAQLYAIESIMDYNPEPDLDKIRAKVLLINDSEDVANPPPLGTVERAMQKVKDGRYVLIPASAQTHGHFTHYYAAVWKPHLIDFMKSLGPAKAAEAR